MKTLVTIIALSVATVFSAQAQETKKATKSATQTTQERTTQQNPADQAKAHTDRMTRDLNLSAEQSKRLLDRNTAYYTEVNKMGNTEGAERNSMMERASTTYDSDIKGILDDTQYERYSTMKDDYMKNMNNKQNQAPMNQDMKRDDNKRK